MYLKILFIPATNYEYYNIVINYTNCKVKNILYLLFTIYSTISWLSTLKLCKKKGERNSNGEEKLIHDNML